MNPQTEATPTLKKEQSSNKEGIDYGQLLQSYSETHWNTVFVDDKFYIAHPLQLDKLMKLESEIKKQKNKLNLNENLGTIQQPGNPLDRSDKSEIDNIRPVSAISRECKTQKNEMDELKQKIKAEKQLIGEQQKYQQRAAQINKKRKQSKLNQILNSELKQNDKKSSSNKTQRQKSGFEQGVIIPQELNVLINSKVSQKKDEPKRSQKSLSQKHDKKSSNFQKQKPKAQQTPQKNYISFHPNEALPNSPKFQPAKTKTAKFMDSNQREQQKSNRYSAQNNNTSTKQGNKSFVVNLRKTPSNSKQVRESLSNSRRDLKSASSATSRIQLENLNKKIKEMQEKLASVEQKQKEFEEIQKSRVVLAEADYQKHRSFQMEDKARKSQNQRYNQQLQQTQKFYNKMQKSGRLQFNNINSNKSSALSEPPKQKVESGQNFDLAVYKTKKLNFASSTVAYNYSEDYAKMRKELEEIKEKEKVAEEREKMVEEIADMKKMIRELKLERIKQEAVIQELEKKQKEKDNINALLSSKLDKGNHSQISSRVINLRIPTQKPQKTQPAEPQLPSFQQSPKKKPNLKIQIESPSAEQKLPPLRRENSNTESPAPKHNKEKVRPIKLETSGSANEGSKSKQLQAISKVGINSRDIVNTSSAANPEEANSYREFHPYPLNKKGIVVRQIMQKQEKGSLNLSIPKSQNPNLYNRSQSPPSPASTGRKIFELQFIKQNRKKTQVPQQQPNLTVPEIKVKSFNIPKIPETPTTDINQVELLKLAKKVCETFSIRIESDDHIYMKKYKNCIIFKTPDVKKTVVWHYSGKFYVGGWDQNENGEGKKTGEGFEFVPDKHWYKGQFLDGKKNGSGTMIFDNGNIYNGQWLKGQKHGTGTFYEQSSGAVYQGQWKEDKKDGKGILKLSEDEFYDGTFIKSIKHGYGLQLFSNGDYYKGEYKIGRFHGKGKYSWKNGASYDGSFVEGKRQGVGRWKSGREDYDVYFGGYKADKKSGKGEYIWANGTVYEGYFVHDLKHGEGRVEYPDGREIRGFWENGKLIEVDQNIDDSEISSQRNSAQQRPHPNKIFQISSKELQPSRKLTKM